MRKDITRRRRLRLTTILFAVILAVSLLFYLEGYRNNDFIFSVFFIFNFICWFAFGFLWLYNLGFPGKNVSFNKSPSLWFQRSGKQALFYLLVIGPILGVFFAVIALEEGRRVWLLRNNETAVTTATVIKLFEKNTRGGAKPYVLLEYSSDAENIERSVFNYKYQYRKGEKLRIRYVKNYPEILEVINVVENHDN